MSKPLRIVFAGTPNFAAASLQSLLSSEHHVTAVYTQPDRPAGRGRKLTASPVKMLAQNHDIPVYQPTSLKNEQAQVELSTLNIDIMIVVAYGLILPPDVLNIPRLGCINLHGSLLPRWRGAAPIQRALLANDKKTGVTIMQMNEGLDTGDMLYKTEMTIKPDDTSETLQKRMEKIGASALIDTLKLISINEAKPEKQDDSQACYAEKLTKHEGKINWSYSATDIERQIRGLVPWPIAYCNINNEPIRIWQATASTESNNAVAGTIISQSNKELRIACGEGSLLLTKIQLPGGKALDVTAILNAKNDLFPTGKQLS